MFPFRPTALAACTALIGLPAVAANSGNTAVVPVVETGGALAPVTVKGARNKDEIGKNPFSVSST